MGFLSPPKLPPPAPLPPPPPSPGEESAEIEAAKAEERRKQDARKGRRSTVLTGPQGALGEAPIQSQALLGR